MDVLLLWNHFKDNEEEDSRPEVENFVDKVVPLYKDHTFKELFQLTRSQCDHLAGAIGFYYDLLNLDIALDKFILVSLWTLANQDSYRDIGDRFGICKGSVSNLIHKFTGILNRHLMGYINWPHNQELEDTLNGFKELGFPNAVCAIDGCHIEIEKPIHNEYCPNPDIYGNGQFYFSINMLMACSSSLKITYIFVGCPGSFNDARVLRISELGNVLQETPSNILNNNDYILADSAYQLTRYCMTPFKNNGQLTDIQRRYNKRHCSARNVIEITFGLLKMRFKRLLYLNMHTLKNTCNAIKACCILHNLSVDKEDLALDIDLHKTEDEEMTDEVAVQQGVGVAIRNKIANSF